MTPPRRRGGPRRSPVPADAPVSEPMHAIDADFHDEHDEHDDFDHHPHHPAAAGDRLLLLCRAGFEAECAEEVLEAAEERGFHGEVEVVPRSACAVFRPDSPVVASLLAQKLRLRDLIFTRELILVGPPVEVPEEGDRLGPVLAGLKALGTAGGELRVGTPDTSEARTLAPFCSRFATPLAEALTEARLLRKDKSRPVLQVVFSTPTSAWLGVSAADNVAPAPMGVPRLKMPGKAPSRATLKLAEAVQAFVGPELAHLIKPGMRAVDLGAAPGGWSWWLASKGMLVTAVDNGDMSAEVMQTGLVEHARADAFRFKPERPADWLVCDVVERPGRIARLVADWVAQGWCRNAIFNLKLPMKSRREEVERCQDIVVQTLHTTGVEYELRIKQLYHDREEVTALLRVTTPARSKSAAAPHRRAAQPKAPGQPGKPVGEGQGRRRSRGKPQGQEAARAAGQPRRQGKPAQKGQGQPSREGTPPRSRRPRQRRPKKPAG